jgi:membrane protein DedA with SNARE-associated domain
LGSDLIVARLGYLGIILVLVLGGLGLPVPEEAPIILSAVLSRNGKMFWPLALASCFAGVLIGDFIVYALGYFQGERVLSFRITRRFLTREREAQIKGYFHRHGMRILITGRFVPGFRTAAYLTAGILRLPPLKLFLADCCAAAMSTLLLFGLGYFFANWVETGMKQAQGYVVAAAAVGIVGWLLHRHYVAQKRGGLPVGPPVPVTDEVPLPVDDLHSGLIRNPLRETEAPAVAAQPEQGEILEPTMTAADLRIESVVMMSEVVVIEEEVTPSCVIASPSSVSPSLELPSPSASPPPRPGTPTSSRPAS